MSAFSQDEKREILDRMAGWLDALDEPEPAPEGLAPEAFATGEGQSQAPDLFSLLSQLAALTQETRLLGRATSRLTTETADKLDKLAEGSGAPAEALAKARREGRLELAAELLDVRDRLARGVRESRARLDAIPAWRLRVSGGAEVLEALVSGSAMALERIDDALGRLSIRQVPCEGRVFDPRTMRAAEAVAAGGGAAPGTVLEVYRTGWLAGEAVLRYAEVKVVAGTREKGKEAGNG